MRSIALTACWLLLFAANGLAYGIVINEVMADNDTTVLDQNGENDDWVELYNPSDTAVFLHSLYLSDRESNPGRWRLPDTTIGANSYLIVWADEDVTQAGLHASFKLSASGEGVFLFDSLLSLLDSVNFGVQTTDISYGRYPNGSGAFNFMYPTFSE
ncbi:MAG: lamin tail domain-containing protein [bacterium]|nr:lamin tail domain-containing protein [bacterium]